MKILVVDDDEDILSFFKESLEGAGHTVKIAINVTEGLDELYLNKMDLIITDLRMPELNGEPFIKIVRNVYPKIPVMVASGDVESKEKLHELGVSKVFEKPVELDKFLEAIKEFEKN